jgi:EGF domain-containing protein
MRRRSLIDECLIDDSPCLNGGTCTNTDGSYTCQCVTPYIGANCETSDRVFMDGFETSAVARPSARFQHP